MVRVGLIDGAVCPELGRRLFAVRGPNPRSGLSFGHGSMVTRSVLEHAPDVEIALAQVFGSDRQASVEQVIDALQWLKDLNVQIVNLSFGLRLKVPRLACAIESVAAQGVIVVASGPARGQPVYPAAYDACVSVTGDARCAPGEISWLRGEAAEFGTHSLTDRSQPIRGGGASIASARMSGLIARLLGDGVAKQNIREVLIERARYVGREFRRD